MTDLFSFIFGRSRRRAGAFFSSAAAPSPTASPAPGFIEWVKSPEFYRSREWQHCRYVALKRAGGRCECCGRDAFAAVLHVDHIKPRSRYPWLALDPANAQVLCDDCNMGKGTWDETDWRNRAAVLRPSRPHVA